MRMLDMSTDKKIDDIMIFLNKNELIQLQGYINQLLENSSIDHCHLSSEDYQKEITLCFYEEKNISHFDDRSQRLLLKDE